LGSCLTDATREDGSRHTVRVSHCADTRTHAPAVIVARPSVASFRKPSTSSRGQVSPGNLSKFDQDQLAAPSALQFVMADLLLWGVPTKARCSSPMSLQRHSILILINAADDSAPNIRKTTHQCMSMEDSDAHTRHHSTGISQRDRPHVHAMASSASIARQNIWYCAGTMLSLETSQVRSTSRDTTQRRFYRRNEKHQYDKHQIVRCELQTIIMAQRAACPALPLAGP
jgi:hypothetical protein